MSLAVLKQTYDEVRRVAIAGSVVAANDFRLKKLAAPLEQLGQKAPVFAKLAQAVTKLAGCKEKESAEALLELSTLVNAVLYTQGETGVDGELAPVESTNLGQQQTRASARVLKPLLEALTTTGSGRIEIIKDAHERGSFRDLRLVGPALAALDDPYIEVSAFMAAEVLPMYGRAIVPELADKLDVKGRGGHVQRLMLLHKLEPDKAREAVKRALDEGSKEMRVAAIECLGSSAEDLAILLEHAKAKAKDVRAAALRALAGCDAAEAEEVLREAFKSGNIELAVQAVAAGRGPRLTALVLEEVNAQWDALLASKEKDKAKRAKQVERMLVALECLQGRDDRETEKFLMRAFGEREALAAIKGDLSGKDVEQRLVSIMAAGPKKAQAALVEAHATLPEDELADAFRAACASRKPAEVFDLFGPYLAGKFHLRKKSRDAASLKREAIAEAVVDQLRTWRYEEGMQAGADDAPDPATRLDKRWLDQAVHSENLALVEELAIPGNAGANKLLSKAFEEQLKKSRDPYEVGSLLRTMVRINHPGATDCVIATIKKHAKAARGYAMYMIPPLIAQLPKEAVPKLEALLPELPEKVMDQVLGHLAELKSRT
jgi:hypothetical protein